MKALAEWSMTGRKQATLAAAICIAVPMLFWLGAALLALVILRQGWREGSSVVMWALLPAIAWLAAGDPTPFLVASGTCALAAVLQQTVRLDVTVMASTLVGVAAYYFLPSQLAELLPPVIEETEKMVRASLAAQPEVADQLVALVGPIIHGALAALHALVIVLCVLLGRYWQSELYNLGGFGREFKQLRLPFAFSMLMILGLMLLGQWTPELAGMAPVLIVPLLLAGLALVHGVVALKKGSSAWLVLTYGALMFAGPYMITLLIFVAVLDGALHFRSRIKDTA